MLVFSGVKVTKNLVVLSAIISLCPVLYLVFYEGNLIKIIKCRIYQWNRKFENSRRALNFETLENILFKRCSWFPLHWRNTKVKHEEVEFRIINWFLKMDSYSSIQKVWVMWNLAGQSLIGNLLWKAKFHNNWLSVARIRFLYGS